MAPLKWLVAGLGNPLLGADRFADCDRVVLVDAVLSPGTSGVTVFTEEAFAGSNARGEGSHSLSPLVAVRLFRQLYPASRTRIAFVTLSADELRLGAAVADEHVEEGVQAVRWLLANDPLGSAADSAGRSCYHR